VGSTEAPKRRRTSTGPFCCGRSYGTCRSQHISPPPLPSFHQFTIGMTSYFHQIFSEQLARWCTFVLRGSIPAGAGQVALSLWLHLGEHLMLQLESFLQVILLRLAAGTRNNGPNHQEAALEVGRMCSCPP